jgi:hypothetical protein
VPQDSSGCQHQGKSKAKSGTIHFFFTASRQVLRPKNTKFTLPLVPWRWKKFITSGFFRVLCSSALKSFETEASDFLWPYVLSSSHTGRFPQVSVLSIGILWDFLPDLATHPIIEMIGHAATRRMNVATKSTTFSSTRFRVGPRSRMPSGFWIKSTMSGSGNGSWPV